jgi:chaperonin GroES
MHFRPVHDRVLVRRIDAEEKTAGGIIIPDTAKEKPQEGEILAAGPGARNQQGQFIPIDVKVGDRCCSANGPAPRSRSTVRTI